MSKTPKVLIIDDEQSVCDVLAVVLRKEGLDVHTSTNPVVGLEMYKELMPEVVIQDLTMPEMDGIELLRHLKEFDPDALVVIMTAYTTWQRAVEAMRLGAYNYIKKPFDNRDIRAVVNRALRVREMQGERDLADAIPAVGGMVGASEPIRRISELVRRVAPTDSTVLIQGESGTGKELVARALHYGSGRAMNAFITVNCGAFTETLLESEMFGHVKGAFTGAVTNKVGLLDVASKGTFFLDEIGEMSMPLQVKLLRVLEEREFKPVGSTKTQHCDVRFIAATNRNLEEEVRNGNFREDLYYRLNVITLSMPPLRDRKEDIPLLAGHFLARFAKRMKKESSSFHKSAMDWLVSYDWPGNIRDLENTVQRAVALSEHEEIQAEDLIDHGRGRIHEVEEPIVDLKGLGTASFNLDDELARIEIEFIQNALKMTSGHVTKAAKLLGISFRSLRYKIDKYGLDKDQGSS